MIHIPSHKELVLMKAFQLTRALFIKRTLGVRTAAGYLRNRGWSLDGALFALTVLRGQ
jgi:hypothetical protein